MVFAGGTSLRVRALFRLNATASCGHAVAAEDVEGGADGEVDPPLAKRGDTLQILHRLGSAGGVGGGDGAVLGDESDEIFVDFLAKPLDVDAVNEGSSQRLARQPSVSALTRRSVKVCQRSVTTK